MKWASCLLDMNFYRSTTIGILIKGVYRFGLFREDRRLVISEENEAKSERVRRELERIRLKSSLLEIIKSTGEVYKLVHLNVCLPTIVFSL